MPLAKAKASVMPATRLLRFNRKSVAPCRRPVTRPVTTKRISVRVSSLARARSSHRANRNRRNPAPAAAAAWAESKPHSIPHRDTKTLFPPSPSKKRSRVAASWPGYFQFFTRAPSYPRAPFRIANRPALDKAAHPRHPIPLARNLRIAQFRGGPTTPKAQTRQISTEFVMGG
jgi:hypothetical protein